MISSLTNQTFKWKSQEFTVHNVVGVEEKYGGTYAICDGVYNDPRANIVSRQHRIAILIAMPVTQEGGQWVSGLIPISTFRNGSEQQFDAVAA